MLANILSVKQLNLYVRSLIEGDARLINVSVKGEISNFKNHYGSGHWYFTLKDQNASIKCVMFKSSASRVKFEVQDGLAVTLKGKVSIYEKDGQYQFYAEEMHPIGEGDLALQFKQVKEKLEREGLFDSESKRSLVKYPKRIAVITSDTGAAVKDILNITSNRYPACEIVMCPVLVQGDMAPQDMIKTLDRVYALDNIDAIIIGRGGGSAEDLHCFNDELLARKIYESPFPVISAVGHETDFTICDFVSDVRASTPSHAAELATPDRNDLENKIYSLKNTLKIKTLFKHNLYETRLNSLQKEVDVSKFENLFTKKQIEIDNIADKISHSINEKMHNNTVLVSNLMTRIDALSPLKVMNRGFSVVTKDNVCVSSAGKLTLGDNITVKFVDGNAECVVKSINQK